MAKNGFNEKDWHLDLLLGPVEKEFLSSEFPKEIEVVAWVDDEASKIDDDYHDVSWEMAPQTPSGKRGLIIAFIENEKYSDSFSDIGEEPDGFCERRMILKLDKRSDVGNKKIHPEFGCWIEITDAKFVCWEPGDDDF